MDPQAALIVVDVQNDFADPAGSLSVRGGDEIVPRIGREIGAARAEGRPVFYTQDWHPGSTPHFQKDGGIWPVTASPTRGARSCIRTSPSTARSCARGRTAATATAASRPAIH